MVILSPGANSVISSSNVTFSLAGAIPDAWDRAGVAMLPVNEKRMPTGAPALLFNAAPWNSWFEDGSDVGCRLQLGSLPQGTTRLLVIVYTYGAAEPISALRTLRLTIAPSILHNPAIQGMGDAAVIIAEFYQRDGEWKVRALVEGSAYGLMHLGRRLGIVISDKHPTRERGNSNGSDDQDHVTSATGTGFAVSSTHIMTCAHVIRDMTRFRLRSLHGTYQIEPVVVDETNDLALMRVIGNVSLDPVAFKDGPSISLGEPIITLGYPLAGLTGGTFAVTQGGISALTGIASDSSKLQFTAPIQPGSSGSPVFDMSGHVVGMVTSAMEKAQNMNFATKSCLALSFLEAARLTPRRASPKPAMAAHELVREVQSSLWLIEAQD